MRQIHQFIVLLLCITAVGIFANWAQNDYGLRIISVSLFGACILFLLGALTTLRGHRFIQAIFLFLSLIPILQPIAEWMSLDDESINRVMTVAVFCSACLGLVLPLILLLLRFFGKLHLSVKNLVFYLYPAFFTAAIGFKLNHFGGANVLLVISGLMVPTMLFEAFGFWNEYRASQVPFVWPKILLCLMIALSWLAAVFKLMHWPGADILGVSGIVSVLVMFGFVVLALLKKGLSAEFFRLSWSLKTIGIVFMIITVHTMLRMRNLAPAFYTTEYPIALEELVSKSDNVSSEGRKNRKRADAFRDHYRSLTERYREIGK